MNEAFNHLIFESQNIPYIYYDADMMKTSTMSHASVGVTGHTGQLFQVSLGLSSAQLYYKRYLSRVSLNVSICLKQD